MSAGTQAGYKPNSLIHTWQRYPDNMRLLSDKLQTVQCVYDQIFGTTSA